MSAAFRYLQPSSEVFQNSSPAARTLCVHTKSTPKVLSLCRVCVCVCVCTKSTPQVSFSPLLPPCLTDRKCPLPNQLGGHFRDGRAGFREAAGRRGKGSGGGGGWRMKKEHVLHCQFSAWYPLFRSLTIKRWDWGLRRSSGQQGTATFGANPSCIKNRTEQKTTGPDGSASARFRLPSGLLESGEERSRSMLAARRVVRQGGCWAGRRAASWLSEGQRRAEEQMKLV